VSLFLERDFDGELLAGGLGGAVFGHDGRAYRNGLVLVTRNVRELAGLGVSLHNPFS
jgi:hypothetical protein